MINGKIYIGITSKNPIIRWNEGDGYKKTSKFYPDIQQYGWDEGFSHETVLTGLTRDEALVKECEYILKYDSVNYGYNTRYADKRAKLPPEILDKVQKRQEQSRKRKNKTQSSNFKLSQFNLYDFAIVNNKQYNFKLKNNRFNFVKIPNEFIRKKIGTEFGLNRIFLVVYILISRNRTYEDKSHMTIGQILNMCGYKKSKNRPKVFYEVVKSILFLKENHYIETDFNFENIGYNDCIELNIISQNFDADKDFTSLFYKDFDNLMTIDSKPSKESLLVCYLYIKSYIIPRKRDKEGNEVSGCPSNSPEAFYRSIENMAKELSMSKDTINQCIDHLSTSTDTHNALLVKREVGSIKPNKNKPPQNVPNIYVLNKSGYQQEIEWALLKMMELYKVDSFDEMKGGKSNAKTN